MSNRFSGEVSVHTKIGSVFNLKYNLDAMRRAKRTPEIWRGDLSSAVEELGEWHRALRWRYDIVFLENNLDGRPEKLITNADIFEGQSAAGPSIMLFRTAEKPLAEAILKRTGALPRWASIDLLQDTKYWSYEGSDGISRPLETTYDGLKVQLSEDQTGGQTNYQLDAVLYKNVAQATQELTSVA